MMVRHRNSSVFTLNNDKTKFWHTSVPFRLKYTTGSYNVKTHVGNGDVVVIGSACLGFWE
jgi:hypothetical protein